MVKLERKDMERKDMVKKSQQVASANMIDQRTIFIALFLEVRISEP
jgi:hypothetical protein